MKTKEYKILSADAPQKLEEIVNQHINKGYEPFGSLTVTQVGAQKMIFQTVILPELPN
jgi:hypothetical protein